MKMSTMDIFIAEMEGDTGQLFERVAGKLFALGYVTDGYEAALLTREKAWPTGLALEEQVNVAIPHTDAAYALGQAIVIVHNPSSSFTFQRMEAPQESIPVKIVFLFAIKESISYVQFLSDLICIFQEERCRELIKEGEVFKIAEYVEEKLQAYQVCFRGPLDLS
jgi:PTS system galactitol-specific IIA component